MNTLKKDTRKKLELNIQIPAICKTILHREYSEHLYRECLPEQSKENQREAIPEAPQVHKDQLTLTSQEELKSTEAQ